MSNDAPILPMEHLWLRVQLPSGKNARIFVSGEMGDKEISALLKIIEAQRQVLADDEQ